MSVEIERKFLVTTGGWKKAVSTKQEIEQGFLAKAKDRVVRVRTVTIKSLGKRFGFITIKGAPSSSGLTRAEFEYEIPIDDACELLDMCVQPLIKKTRHIVRDKHSQRWEIDVFKGINDGLILAEIELRRETEYVAKPSWIGREVTFDKRFTNVYLSTHQVSLDQL